MVMSLKDLSLSPHPITCCTESSHMPRLFLSCNIWKNSKIAAFWPMTPMQFYLKGVTTLGKLTWKGDSRRAWAMDRSTVLSFWGKWCHGEWLFLCLHVGGTAFSILNYHVIYHAWHVSNSKHYLIQQWVTWTWNAHTVVNSKRIKKFYLSVIHSWACLLLHWNPHSKMCGLHIGRDRMWLCKNRMPGLFSSPLHSTMQDKFTPREPFVGCTSQAICSFLGERQLTLHLSPPAAGYNSTHFEPLSRGADGGPGIRIPHHNGSAGKQKTDELGTLRLLLRKRSKYTWHWMTGT